ncbi:MAG: RnfABCDGE type electron transport complex subunit B [Lachnospiraceae bacterium]|nr:RnfABCDGE type electron transport complex subunit B [Lachnospiraceae bacterium]
MMNLLLGNLLSSTAVLAFNVKGIAMAAAVVGVTGLIIGVLLGLAAKAFHVEVDEKEVAVRELLPGNNCGGCGYAGCDGLAKAIAEGSAPVSGCPVAGASIHAEIGKVMGQEVSAEERKVAFVKCNGTCDKTERKYNYNGITDCKQLAVVPGNGEKVCSYGCCGYGSCVKVCAFDAIHIVNGVAVVDKEKCVACGKCVAECPKNLIEFVPESATHLVQCSSHDKGKDVKAGCSTGCIACTLCVKQCEFDAIHVTDNLAKIDYDKCTRCGKCALKCPQKIIL